MLPEDGSVSTMSLHSDQLLFLMVIKRYVQWKFHGNIQTVQLVKPPEAVWVVSKADELDPYLLPLQLGSLKFRDEVSDVSLTVLFAALPNAVCEDVKGDWPWGSFRLGPERSPFRILLSPPLIDFVSIGLQVLLEAQPQIGLASELSCHQQANHGSRSFAVLLSLSGIHEL